MTPPIDLPPPPPAIHAPVPHRTVNAARPFSMSARTVQMFTRLSAFDPINDLQGSVFSHFRWLHTKHHRGAKHKSQKSRSKKRKAARRK